MIELINLMESKMQNELIAHRVASVQKYASLDVLKVKTLISSRL